MPLEDMIYDKRYINTQATPSPSTTSCEETPTIWPRLSAFCEMPSAEKLDDGRGLTFLVTLKIAKSDSYSTRHQATNRHDSAKVQRQSPDRHMLCSPSNMKARALGRDDRGWPGMRKQSLGATVSYPTSFVLLLAISPRAHQVKIDVVRRSLRCLTKTLEEDDYFGIVSPCSQGRWEYSVTRFTQGDRVWEEKMASLPFGGHNYPAVDVMAGINIAIHALTEGQSNATLCPTLMVVSDVTISKVTRINSLVARANAENIGIHTFGLGMRHDADVLVQLASRTNAAYTYVKDWMALPESLVSCLRLLQSFVLVNVKLRLRLEDSSPVLVQRIDEGRVVGMGAAGQECIVSLGNLCLDDQRDIVVHLVGKPNMPQTNQASKLPQVADSAAVRRGRPRSDEDGPVYFQVDVTWDDITHGSVSVQHPGLLNVRLPMGVSHLHSSTKIPSMGFNSNLTQRRLELFVADMLTKLLKYVSSGRTPEAVALITHICHVLRAVYGQAAVKSPVSSRMKNELHPHYGKTIGQLLTWCGWQSDHAAPIHFIGSSRDASRVSNRKFIAGLLKEAKAWSEWIAYPDLFNNDTRKAVLQAINDIRTQRAFTGLAI